MKISMMKLAVFFLALVLVANVATAQTRKRPVRKRSTSGNAATDYFGNPVNNTPAPPPANNKTNSNTNNTNTNTNGTGASADDYFSAAPAAANGDTTRRNRGGNANVPYETVPSTGNALTDMGRPSLRSEDAIERNLVKERTPLAYEHIREDDAVYRQRVWRNIDTREKMNLTFRNPASEGDGSQLFISILYRAIVNDSVTAFEDERFTNPYSLEDFKRKFSGGVDTTEVLDLEGNVVKKQIRQREFLVDSIFQFQLKEEWIFDKESSRMFVRILGIAPMMKTYLSDGTPVSEEPYPLFWVYYPDLRPSLAKSEVINTKNFGGRMSWEELFESRFFTSYITKSTLDNPFDQSLKMFIKDPLFRLLEGENIKEKIFNYEQDLWSY